MSTCRIYARRGGRRAVVQYADKGQRAATLKETFSLRKASAELAAKVTGDGGKPVKA
ncbi:hypothetical protein [Streptomyces mirabilis]